MPDLAALAGPVTAQLVQCGTGTCWKAVYSAPFQQQDATRLRARGE